MPRPRRFDGTDGRFVTPWTRSREPCPVCGQRKVQRRVMALRHVDADDLQFHCLADGCGKIWWEDGPEWSGREAQREAAAR